RSLVVDDLEPDDPAQLLTGAPPPVGQLIHDPQAPAAGHHIGLPAVTRYPRHRRAAAVPDRDAHPVPDRADGDVEPAVLAARRGMPHGVDDNLAHHHTP